MRRRLQFVTILAMALLAAEPALTGLSCSMDASGHSSDCHTSMAAMGADCPMNLEACAPDCCNHIQPPSMATASSLIFKPKLAAPSALLGTSPVRPALPDHATGSHQAEILGAPPPRYLLLRIFRI